MGEIERRTGLISAAVQHKRKGFARHSYLGMPEKWIIGALRTKYPDAWYYVLIRREQGIWFLKKYDFLPLIELLKETVDI